MKRDVSSSTPASGDSAHAPDESSRISGSTPKSTPSKLGVATSNATQNGGDAVDQLLISAKEAAKRLGISPRLLWSMTAGGEIPHVRVRRRVLFSPQSLREWVAAREDQGGRQASEWR